MLDAFVGAFTAYMQSGQDRALDVFLEEDANLSFLAVYRNGYLKTCVDALAANFPAVRSVVGAEYFKRLALNYIDACPPERTTLVGYGARFSDHLADSQPGHGLLYLGDIARFDLAWMTAYFSADADPLMATDIDAMAAPGDDVSALSAPLSPCVQRFTTSYRTSSIWAEIRDTGELRSMVDVETGAEEILLWRENEVISYRLLAAPEATFIDTLQSGANLGDAAANALADDAGFDIAACFGRLLQHGILGKETSRS